MMAQSIDMSAARHLLRTTAQRLEEAGHFGHLFVVGNEQDVVYDYRAGSVPIPIKVFVAGPVLGQAVVSSNTDVPGVLGKATIAWYKQAFPAITAVLEDRSGFSPAHCGLAVQLINNRQLVGALVLVMAEGVNEQARQIVAEIAAELGWRRPSPS